MVVNSNGMWPHSSCSIHTSGSRGQPSNPGLPEDGRKTDERDGTRNQHALKNVLLSNSVICISCYVRVVKLCGVHCGVQMWDLSTALELANKADRKLTFLVNWHYDGELCHKFVIACCYTC